MSFPQEIEALFNRWAALQRSGDAAGCADLYSEDAVINSFSKPIKAEGRKRSRPCIEVGLKPGRSTRKFISVTRG